LKEVALRTDKTSSTDRVRILQMSHAIHMHLYLYSLHAIKLAKILYPESLRLALPQSRRREIIMIFS
jgi:hypothetical protein